MIAHIIHDSSGTIKSIVFQGTDVPGGTEVPGELRIKPEHDDLVTVVGLSRGFPRRGCCYARDRIVRDIRSGFRLDVKRKTLEKLK